MAIEFWYKVTALHPGMLLFPASKGDALKRHHFEEEKDQIFVKPAQTLSTQYPPGSGEKRWVDGVCWPRRSHWGCDRDE